MKRSALVVITDGQTRVMLQLRDAMPTIGHPNHWGLFGGKIEGGETPREAAVREVQEELGLVLDADRLAYVGDFAEAPIKTHTVFAYRGGDELYTAVLMEGQRIGWFSADTFDHLHDGMLDGHRIIPVVEHIVRGYLARRRAGA